MFNKCQVSAPQSSPCLILASPLGWYTIMSPKLHMKKLRFGKAKYLDQSCRVNMWETRSRACTTLTALKVTEK